MNKHSIFYFFIIVLLVIAPLSAESDGISSEDIKEGASKVFSSISDTALKVADSVKTATEETKENIKQKQAEATKKCIGTWNFDLATESYSIKIKKNGDMQIVFKSNDNKTTTWSGLYKIDTAAIHFYINEIETRHFLVSKKQPADTTWSIWYSFKNLPENQIKITCSDFPKNEYAIEAAKNTVYTK